MNQETFELHPRLAADSILVGALPLSQVRLMNDATFPWCLVIPQRIDVREIHELSNADRMQLMDEVSSIAVAMQKLFAAHKMNIAALGNLVPQLHVHVIARFETDSAWPAPVWGKCPPQPYSRSEQEQQLEKLRGSFGFLHDFRTDV